jgi:hypothetical protein
MHAGMRCGFDAVCIGALYAQVLVLHEEVLRGHVFVSCTVYNSAALIALMFFMSLAGDFCLCENVCVD